MTTPQTWRERFHKKFYKIWGNLLDISGNSSSLEDLKDYIQEALTHLLDQVEVAIGEDIPMKHAIKTHSDAGAGYTIGVNSFKKDLRETLAHLRKGIV